MAIPTNNTRQTDGNSNSGLPRYVPYNPFANQNKQTVPAKIPLLIGEATPSQRCGGNSHNRAQTLSVKQTRRVVQYAFAFTGCACSAAADKNSAQLCAIAGRMANGGFRMQAGLPPNSFEKPISPTTSSPGSNFTRVGYPTAKFPK